MLCKKFFKSSHENTCARLSFLIKIASQGKMFRKSFLKSTSGGWFRIKEGTTFVHPKNVSLMKLPPNTWNFIRIHERYLCSQSFYQDIKKYLIYVLNIVEN